MRWRSGETPGIDEFMVLLLSMNEADCLARQHRRTAIATNYHRLVEAVTAERFSPLAELRR
jgi:hypothetical protein